MKNIKNRKRSRVALGCILAVVLIVAVGIFAMQQKQDNTVYNSYTVKTGDIENFVKRTGQMTATDVTNITLCNGVTIDELLVQVNDTVQVDTKIASLDVEAMNRLFQNATAELSEAERTLRALDEEKTTDKIKAPVSGRIKEINKDDFENDVLIRMSLDGKMKVNFTADKEIDIKNAKILVKTEKGNEYSGTVVKHEQMAYTVTISDKSVANGVAVTIYADDTIVGTGVVEISSEYIITGALDNVSEYLVSVNDEVKVDKELAELKSNVPTEKYLNALYTYKEALERQAELDALVKDPYFYAGTDGVVSALYIEENAAHVGTGDRAIAAQVIPMQPDSFVVNIPEHTIAGVQVGMPATVTLTAYPDRELNAYVSFINPVGIVASGSSSYEVRFQMEDTDGIMIGMTGAVAFVSQKVEDCVVLPMELVRESDDGSFYVLVPGEDGASVTKQIEIGISNEDYVQVTCGLAEGDTVLYVGTLINQE